MFRSAVRIASGPSIVRALPKQNSARRFISTAPPHHKSRSWKSSAARWGLAGALVYYYNTATAFAEEPSYPHHAAPESSREHDAMPTVESISEKRRAQANSQSPPSGEDTRATTAAAPASGTDTATPGSPEELEEEAGQQGAFNEETGEINWDCPCLGGMAHGPCGEQFRAAFSCFVFSTEEPKGVDCIEHFKTMQNCFREHPELYGSELDEDEPGADGQQGEAAAGNDPAGPPGDGPAQSAESHGSAQSSASEQHGVPSTPPPSTPAPPAAASEEASSPPPAADKATQAGSDFGTEATPKAWHDSR